MRIDIYTPKYINEVGAMAEKQENALWPQPDKETANDKLFIVCDAKGNDGCGDKVSQAMCKTLATWFKENASEGEHVNDELLKNTLEDACKELEIAYNDKNIRFSMGLLFLNSDGATFAYIGDCRLYHARAKKHKSFLSWFKKNFEILYQSADQPAIKLGKTGSVNPVVMHITDIQPNDVLAICNAGMLEMDEADEELFIGSIMSHRIGMMSFKETDLNYFKKEIAQILCMYNHSAWVIKISNI